MRVMTLADIGAVDPGDAHRDREVVGDAVGGARRRALNRADAVGVDVLAGGGDQRRIAEPAEADVFVEERDRAMAGLQGRSRNGDDRPGAAGIGGAAGVMREDRRTGYERESARADCAPRCAPECDPEGHLSSPCMPESARVASRRIKNG
jgi:hypothetical protein